MWCVCVHPPEFRTSQHFSLCLCLVQQEFTKKYKSEICKYGMLQKWDDSKQYLTEHNYLVCEETANYLVIWCIDLEVEEVCVHLGCFCVLYISWGICHFYCSVIYIRNIVLETATVQSCMLSHLDEEAGCIHGSHHQQQFFVFLTISHCVVFLGAGFQS